MPDLVGKDAAGGYVVAVAETAGDAEDLVVRSKLRRCEQLGTSGFPPAVWKANAVSASQLVPGARRIRIRGIIRDISDLGFGISDLKTAASRGVLAHGQPTDSPVQRLLPGFFQLVDRGLDERLAGCGLSEEKFWLGVGFSDTGDRDPGKLLLKRFGLFGRYFAEEAGIGFAKEPCFG